MYILQLGMPAHPNNITEFSIGYETAVFKWHWCLPQEEAWGIVCILHLPSRDNLQKNKCLLFSALCCTNYVHAILSWYYGFPFDVSEDIVSVCHIV